MDNSTDPQLSLYKEMQKLYTEIDAEEYEFNQKINEFNKKIIGKRYQLEKLAKEYESKYGTHFMKQFWQESDGF